MKIALQAYTLREEAGKDMAGTLKTIAEKGYSGVELAGFNGLSANQIAKVLKENNLTAVSAHVSYHDLDNDTETWCNNAKTLGLSKITIPWAEPELLKDDNIISVAAIINRVAEKLSECGIELSYHNHDFEIREGCIYRLMELCPLLKIELDTYWAKFAGADPVSVMEKCSDRITLIHLKDMQDKPDITHEDANPNILEGCMNIKSILENAERIGIEWVIVEMDMPMGDPVNAISKSRSNLKEIGY